MSGILNEVNEQIRSLIDEKDNKIKRLEEELKQKDKLLLSHSERLIQELEIASQLQHELIPKSCPTIRNLKVEFKYVPMHQIGGDFFDFIKIGEHKYGIFLSDVSGHGIAAAFITSMIKTSIVNHKNFVSTPRKMLYVVNSELHGRIHGNFVTACYGIFDLANLTMHFSTAGHPPILHYHKETNEVTELITDNMIVGIMDNLQFKDSESNLKPGDRILFYTDGIYEVFNEKREEFGLDNLKKMFLKSSEMPLEEVSDYMIEEVVNYSAIKRLDDDIAIIVVEVE